MNKKTAILLAAFLGLVILFYVIRTKDDEQELITMGVSASLREMTIDDLIAESEIIMIGEVKTILPSQWLSPNGKNIKDATPDEIFNAQGLFTDTLISINQTLKGINHAPVIRVRSFIGETDKVRWVNDSEVSYNQGQTYVLFLIKNFGPSVNVDPGGYISVNSYLGVYEVVDGKAISKSNEWVLEELIAYIQKSLSEVQ